VVAALAIAAILAIAVLTMAIGGIIAAVTGGSAESSTSNNITPSPIRS
jgi:hypothetical protein